MKKSTLCFAMFLCTGLCIVSSAQQPLPAGYFTSIPLQPTAPERVNASLASVIDPIPLWTYNIVASPGLGGKNYSGKMLGLSPYNHGKTTTTIKTQIIPLIITIDNSSATPGDIQTYDPTATDACITGSQAPYAPIDVVMRSPLFNNNPWTMNGIYVGNTQYIDAFQRAEFWSLVGGTGYHLTLSQTTLAAQPLTFGSAAGNKGIGANYDAGALFGGCGFVGVVQIADLDAAVTALIRGPLAASVNAGTFPIFLTKSVVMANSGDNIFSNCCDLGYHGAFTTGSQLQIYAPLTLDASRTFGGDISVMSHEIAEAINDPTAGNQTPPWGAVGEVGVGSCQDNLEVADPLTPGLATPANGFTVAGANGFTYHLQELAFVSWFYGGASLGAGGKYSSNGTFGGSAKPCPPGGSN